MIIFRFRFPPRHRYDDTQSDLISPITQEEAPMKPWRIFGVVGLVLLAGVLSAQDSPQKGTIKKVDADRSILTITADGKDLVVKVAAETKVMDAKGKQIIEPFKDNVFKAGTSVLFKTDGDTLVGIRVGGDAKQDKGSGKQPGNIRQGKITAIDLDKLTVTFKTPDNDIDAIVTEQTQFFEVKGKDLKECLQAFKVGAEVNYVVQPKNGKNYLVGIRALGAGGKGPPFVKVDSSKLVPLNELGDREYKDGYKGGFYPDGKNERPKDHEAAGLRFAKQIQPRNAEGKVHPQGKIVLLSVGMSNTSQASNGFQKVLAGAEGVNPQVVFVNGAVGGQTASRIQNPDNADGAKYWGTVDQRLKDAGVTRDQVQVVWIKEADAGPNQGFPGYAKKLEEELTRIVQIFPKRFPNAKLVYLSSRTYGGFATTALNPEPYAYESAFSVKWLIERQIKQEAGLNFDADKGELRAPWLSWGPYLWANGSKKRADGFRYESGDFTANDGTHLTASGMEKAGRLMLHFFQNDSTTRPWFMAK
jgi:Cu/Ag efflux protein CusF